MNDLWSREEEVREINNRREKEWRCVGARAEFDRKTNLSVLQEDRDTPRADLVELTRP